MTLAEEEEEEEEGEKEEGEGKEKKEKEKKKEEEGLTDLHAVHLSFEDGVVVLDTAPVTGSGKVVQVEAILLQNIQSFDQSAHSLHNLGGRQE